MPILNGNKINVVLVRDKQGERIQIRAKKIPLNGPEIGTKSKVKDGVQCWIKSVPKNEGSFEMHIPIKGTWRIKLKKEELAKKFPELKQCKKESGDVFFTVNGKPNNEAILKSIKEHEKRHAADIKYAFEKIVGDWDKKMTNALKSKTLFEGDNINVCEAKLFKHMGGTRDEIETKLFTEGVNQVHDFHCKYSSCTALVAVAGRADEACNAVTANVKEETCKMVFSC